MCYNKVSNLLFFIKEKEKVCMEIKTYRKIWGTLKDSTINRGYFPTPHVGFVNRYHTKPNTNALIRYDNNYELKKALLAAQD